MRTSGFCIGATLIWGLLSCGGPSEQVQEDLVSIIPPEPVDPIIRFGLDWETFAIDSGRVASGQSLSHVLDPTGIGAGAIAQIAQTSRGVFDVRSFRAGQPWWIAFEKDSVLLPAHLIYQLNSTDYARFSLQEPYTVVLESLPTDTVTRRVTGVIENSLYVDLERLEAPTTLALAMANVYAWTVDFSRLQPGDAFDVLYERTYVNQKPVGMPRVIACHFEHRGRNIPAYRFDQGDGLDYFDDLGQSLRKAFLKSPVEFSRISSRYNLKRFHPILNKTKAHYGTDYAAPHGTPILAVGDGVVTKSAYTEGNGKYVKIRHNSTYETQYLHMSKRAVSVGQTVRQGQVIGYVGSTGLATGPHVCFRFWKNGKQVDHLREDFPPSAPILDENMTEFQKTVAALQAAIASMEPIVR